MFFDITMDKAIVNMFANIKISLLYSNNDNCMVGSVEAFSVVANIG